MRYRDEYGSWNPDRGLKVSKAAFLVRRCILVEKNKKINNNNNNKIYIINKIYNNK